MRPGDPADRPADRATDRELLDRHVHGDTEAFGELVRRHRDRLWAVALRTLGDREEAADALQDALISALRNAGSYRGEAAVTTWLHRIVVNACLDRVRRQRARPTVPLPADDGPGAAGGAVVDQADRRDTALDVEAALATLPVEQRAALVLVDMQGWSVEQAAQILGVPPGTVKSRCSRGRARLLPLLRHLRGDAARNPDIAADVPSTSRPADGGDPAP